MAGTRMPRGAEAYRRIEAESRSPMELVLMLYDGALRFISEARQANTRGDVRARQQALSKTMAIVSELQSTLDVAKGGDVARELDRLYTYVATRLIDVTVKRDAAALDEVHKLLTPVRDAWAQIATAAPGAKA